MEKQQIRIVKKNDSESMEYQIGDVFAVDSTWYGGVNVTSKTGIPLSLDREEYEDYKGEIAVHPIDKYSYDLGVMDCFCEMVSTGLKKLALSHPYTTGLERDAYLDGVKKLCAQYGVSYYVEDELIETDLFPRKPRQRQYLYLFYRTEDVLEAYLRLKEQQRSLDERNNTEEPGTDIGQQRRELAREFGRLLSYPEDGIERLLNKAARQ